MFNSNTHGMSCSHTRNFRTYTLKSASVTNKRLSIWPHVYNKNWQKAHAKFLPVHLKTVTRKKKRKTRSRWRLKCLCAKPTQSKHLTKLSDLKSWESENINYLICHMNSQDHVIEGSRDIKWESLIASLLPVRFGGHRHCGGKDIFNFPQDHVNQEPLYLKSHNTYGHQTTQDGDLP